MNFILSGRFLTNASPLICSDEVLVALAEEEEIEEKIAERNLIVQRVPIDLETAKNIVDREKTKFFAKAGLLRPKHEEIEVESILLFYDPFTVAKAKYLLDFYEKIYIEKEWCHQSLAPFCSNPDEEYIRLSMEKGFPILDKSAIQFDMKILEEFFQRLLLLSREKSSDAAAKLTLYLEEDSISISTLIREMWEGKLSLDNLG